MGIKLYYHDIDLVKGALLNAALQPLPTASAPVSPALGQHYFDTTLNRPRYWTGSAWTDWSAATGATNISVTAAPASLTIASSSGTSGSFPLATATNAGAYPPGDFSKLAALPTNAALASSLALKADLASPTFTGAPAAPTAAPGTNTTQVATTAFVGVALGTKADLASPTFTGVPAAPTAAAGANTTQVATTAFVSTAVANLVASSPAALDTLNELAAALGNDANFSATVTASLAGKASLSHTHTASQISDSTATGRSVMTAATQAAARTAIAAVGKFTADIGGATSIVVTHSLGTKDVVVSFRLVATDEEVQTTWVSTSVNTLTATFNAAPAASSVRVVVIG